MTTAREIMHTGATCVGEHETLTTAAQHMRELRLARRLLTTPPPSPRHDRGVDAQSRRGKGHPA